jgi:hypothetical protein
MFNDLYDAISRLWSWRWPLAEGEVTAVDIERMRHDRNSETARIAVAYEFSVGERRTIYRRMLLGARILLSQENSQSAETSCP